MPDDSQKKQAQITVLRLLAATPKSRKQLSDRLEAKGFNQKVIEETLDQMAGQGIVNDTSFARNIATQYSLAKPSGKRRIRFEMKRRGVPEQVQDDVLSRISAEEETARAQELAQARWEKLRNLPSEKRQKRLFDFMLRRGFDYSAIKDIIQKLERTKNEDE